MKFNRFFVFMEVILGVQQLLSQSSRCSCMDKRGQIVIATILCATIMLFLLPLIVYIGVMSSMTEIKIDADQE